MNIVLLLFVVTAAAIVGNSIGYAIGRWGGRLILNKLRVDPQRQQHLDDLFRRRGGFVVLFGRFIDGLRQLNGIVAGTMKMPWRSFTAYNAAGAVLWTGAWGLGTYYLGRRIHVVAGFFHHHRLLLIALSVTALMVFLVYLFRPKIREEACPRF
jgi:membrane protein DedA with SNARE-associated domain